MDRTEGLWLQSGLCTKNFQNFLCTQEHLGFLLEQIRVSCRTLAALLHLTRVLGCIFLEEGLPANGGYGILGSQGWRRKGQRKTRF